MLHELEVLEAMQIAELASDARKVRDRLLERVRDAELGEPVPARGEHNPGGTLALDDVLATEPEFVALREAIQALPREIRAKLWAVMRVDGGGVTVSGWNEAIAGALAASDDDIVGGMIAEPDLHEYLRKGLYELRAVP